MRRWSCLFAAAVCLVLAACGAADRPLLDAESSIFRTLDVTAEGGVAADLEADLAETEAAFLYLELREAADATLHYTYSTEGRAGVQLRVCPPEGEALVCDLPAADEDAYDALWVDEAISLQAGTTVFSLTGEGVTCRMRLEINGLAEENLLSAGMA